MEGPFSDKEKRAVLTEAIKTSSVTVDQLLTFITGTNVEPVWSEMLLPFGRNLNSCRNVWETLLGVPSSNPSNLAAPPTERKRKSGPEVLEPFQAAPQPKRRQSGADSLTHIRPKPSSNGSPLAFSTASTAQPPKKRGRPSKADVEARNAAAIARGEVIPPPRTPALRETMGGEVSTEPAIASSGFGAKVAIAPNLAPGPPPELSMSAGRSFLPGPREGEDSGTAEKKKRGRPSSRSSKEPRTGESSFSAFNPPLTQVEVTRPPTARPAEGLSDSPVVPPKPEAKAEALKSPTPVPPPHPKPMSPETQQLVRSQRSDI